MKGKGLKQRFMGTFLSCVLALSTVVGTPMTANAEGGMLAEVVDCTAGFATNKSPLITVTEEAQTYVFSSVTNTAASNNCDTPSFFVYSEDGTELFVGRSDVWGCAFGDWDNKNVNNLPDGYSYEKSFGVPFVDWPTWVEDNKKGVECKITMQQVGTSAIVTFTNNGVTSTTTIPTSGPTYVALSGEHCKLTNIRTEGTPIPEPDEPGTDEPGTDTPGTGDSGNLVLDCPGWWVAHTDGFEITPEIHTYVFQSKSNPDAKDNWETPSYVIFNSEDAKVNGAGYKEYGVIRSDKYHWDGEGTVAAISEVASTADGEGFDWVSWVAANKNGVDCFVTTQLYNNVVLIGVSNNGVTTTYVVPVDASVKNYVSLTGQNCVLSNWQLSDQHIDLSAAKAKADELASDPGTDTPGTDTPGTEDPGNVFLECGDFWTAHTEGFEITTTPCTYVFHSKTNGTKGNYETPLYVVFHSEDGLVKKEGEAGFEGYKEYGVIRSDNYHWDGAGKVAAISKVASTADGIDYDWATWLATNRAGVDCAVTTQLYNNNVLIGVSNNGLITTYVVPVDTSVKNYLSLSGENCTLSNRQTSDQHIDLSAAKAKADELASNPGTDTPTNVFLDCGDFWSAHTDGFAITEQLQSYSFHSQTYANALANWETPLYVVYHSSDAKVNGENYREYGVLRSDNWFWDGAGKEFPMIQATYALPEDWAAWQASNRTGADCIVSTQLYNGCALIGVSNNGVTNTYAIRIDPNVTNYLSLTGEHCTLSNLQATDQHIDLGQARVYADVLANYSHNPYIPAAAPTGEVKAVEGGEVLAGSAWWTGMAIGSNQPMSGDGTWTWMVQASSLIDGYGAFSVEIYDPATNGYITTGSDKNAWTAEGFEPTRASVSGVAAELASNLVEGHTYAVTVNRSGNTFTIQYVDSTDGTEVCTLTVTPGETVSNDVVTHIMAQVGTYTTSFGAGNASDITVSKAKTTSGEVLTGTEWWNGMTVGSNKTMSGDGTWTWTVRASKLVDGYGAFSVEVYDPATNGYITTGSDKNAWTAEGFDPTKASVSGVASELASNLVEGHTYAVTVNRSGNTFTITYTDHTTGKEICKLVVTPGETVGKDVMIHVMAQVGTFSTAFSEGTLIAALGDTAPIALCVILVIGLAAIAFGVKKRFAR